MSEKGKKKKQDNVHTTTEQAAMLGHGKARDPPLIDSYNN